MVRKLRWKRQPTMKLPRATGNLQDEALEVLPRFVTRGSPSEPTSGRTRFSSDSPLLADARAFGRARRFQAEVGDGEKRLGVQLVGLGAILGDWASLSASDSSRSFRPARGEARCSSRG